MWQYEKKLQYPVNIKNPNPKYAQIIISQYGGPDGELGASLRYLSQRYSMPTKEAKGLLTDIGTEELAHMEIVSAIIHQLTRDMTPEQIKKAGFSGSKSACDWALDCVWALDCASDCLSMTEVCSSMAEVIKSIVSFSLPYLSINSS